MGQRDNFYMRNNRNMIDNRMRFNMMRNPMGYNINQNWANQGAWMNNTTPMWGNQGYIMGRNF